MNDDQLVQRVGGRVLNTETRWVKGKAHSKVNLWKSLMDEAIKP